MNPDTRPSPTPRRPAPAGVSRLALLVATVAAALTISAAAAVSGAAPASSPTATVAAPAAEAAAALPITDTIVRTVYVPPPQPTAAPELPVKVVVVHKASHSDDEGEHEGGDD